MRSLFARENRRLVFALVVGAVAAAFAVLNFDEVEVNWLITTSSTPLVIVIVVAFAAGAVTGWLLARRSRTRGPAMNH